MLKVENLNELENLEIFEENNRRGKTFTRKERIYLHLQRVIRNPKIWQGRLVVAFWTIFGIFSLLVNIVLIALLIGLARELFTIKTLISTQLIDGLQTNFTATENAFIETTVFVDETITVNKNIIVNDSIPIMFDLEFNEKSEVRLIEATSIENALVNIQTSALTSNQAPADIVLPKGTILPIKINFSVPVSQTVPLNLSVPVQIDVPVQLSIPISIPLKDIDLQESFSGLQNDVQPYQLLFQQAPDFWQEIACNAGQLLCWLIEK